MKRTRLSRRKPLSRGPGPKRKTRLAAVNRKRAAQRKADPNRYGEHHRAMDHLPCILAGKPGHRCIGPVVGHHLKRVGNGGQDAGNEVPACTAAHDELHWSERKVEERYDIDLAAAARRLNGGRG